VKGGVRLEKIKKMFRVTLDQILK